MSSDASMNTTRGVMLRVASSVRTESKSPVNPRDRTSITTASWVIRDPAASPKSTIRVINWGGRLSATYQPRSSSTLAAVPRPAPDNPVTRTTSMPSAGSIGRPSAKSPAIRVSGLLGSQRLEDGRGGGHADTRNCGDLVDGGLLEAGYRSEMGYQRLAAMLSQSWHRIQRRGGHSLGSLAAMVGDGEAMRLVTDPLQQVEPLAVARHDDRIRLGRDPYLFQPLGQADHRDVADTQFFERGAGGVDLRRTAVDDIQVGRVGEPARFPLRGKHIRVVLIIQVPQEPAASHLGDGGDVVGAPLSGGLPDREVAVVRFARQTVLEHHQRGHHIGALHVADVDAFDAQRRVGQAQRVLNALQRSRSGVEVAGPPQLVLLQSLFRVALHGLGQRALV